MLRKLALATATAALASISLAGTAGAAAVTTSPAAVDFGSQAVGTTSAPRNVQVDVPCLYVLDLGQYGGKSCTAPGKLEAAATTGDFAQSNACPLPITNSSTSGEVVTCTIAVTFTPSAAGARSGALNLTSYGDADAYVVPLAGTGTTLPSGGDGDGAARGANGQGTGQGGAAGAVAPSKRCKKGKAAKRAGKCKGKRKVVVS